MSTRDMLRQMAGKSFGQLRLDNVEAAIRFHGTKVGAPPPVVDFIVNRAKRAITEGGRSGSYAVRQGEQDIDFIMGCLGKEKVVRFPGERLKG